MHLVARHHQTPALPRRSRDANSSWIRPLPDPADSTYGVAVSLTIGRTEADWNVPWDDQISRQHVRLQSLESGKIQIEKLENATNPVFYRGDRRERFTLGVGESFVIGQTRFECIETPTMQADPDMLRSIAIGDWVDDPIDDDRIDDDAAFNEGVAVDEVFAGDSVGGVGRPDRDGDVDPKPNRPAAVVSAGHASSKLNPGPTDGGREQPAEDSQQSVQILTRQLESLHRLPKLLRSSRSLDEAISRVVEMVRPLLAGVTEVAVVSVPSQQSNHRESERRGVASDPVIISGDGMDHGDAASPVHTLAPDLLRRVARDQRAILQHGRGADRRPRFMAGLPLGKFGDARWVWWMAGTGRDRAAQRQAMRYLSVVSQMAHQWYRDRAAIRRQNTMARFFSPTVLASMADHEHRIGGDGEDAHTLRDLLEPRTVELTILFFDLRGFTDWTNSQAAAGDLSGLMERLHESLSIVTRQILRLGGVVGDFHGDAVMGFWGWPIEPASVSSNCDNAVAAALAIGEALGTGPMVNRSDGPSVDSTTHRLSASEMGLSGGVGIATGEAVAGAIGSDDQLKVTAIGPAVNLAARLQNETRRLSEDVVIDAATRGRLSETAGEKIECRSLPPLDIRGWNHPVEAFGVSKKSV